MVECNLAKVEVAGSNPVSRSTYCSTKSGRIMISNLYSPLAQSVEQVTVNHLVLGSSPRWGAKKIRRLQDFLVGAFSVYAPYCAKTVLIADFA